MPYDELELVDTIELVNSHQWDNLVEQSPTGTFFQKIEWLKAIEEGLDVEARHLLAYSKNNIVALFPNFLKRIRGTSFQRLISLPLGCGGPIITSSEGEILNDMLDRSSRLCRGRTISHEISMLNPNYVGYWGILRERGYNPIYRCNFQHNLSKGIEQNYNNLDKSKKKVLKNYYRKYTFEVEHINHDNLTLFYDSYMNLMKKIKADAYPLEFFDTLIKYCKDNTLITTQYLDGRYVGSKLSVIDNVNNTLYAALSGVERKRQTEHSSFLLIWHMIEWGIENKFDIYDLGPTSDDFRNGVFNFKNSLGGTIVPNISWERTFYPLKPFYRLAQRMYGA
ncbi:MAG TPA: GNAT family N-acetyltransferase [Candidatus Methanofastidiosa archaeon]|nr:GNAT family N-acetyltransferase [Candidatus Methanofastidiosa archaeon]HPR42065.1 GNAT family N-acetyltransferase [Candidatus Methanofastidiosa archaeon]